MSRRLAATLALVVLVIAAVAVWRFAVRGTAPDAHPGDPHALLRTVPYYRSIVPAGALLAAERTSDGTLRLDLAPPALLRERLTEHGLSKLGDALPARARGEIRANGESWRLDDAAVFSLLDRDVRGPSSSALWGTLPGTPSAVEAARIVPARLADPDFGGAALDDWRARADLAERVLGRPLRAQLAEDLGGLVLFALYEPPPGGAPEALVAVELKRSDRLRSLFDTVFALAALTDRASIARYRDVPVGLFRAASAGGRLAMAIDGDAAFVARSERLVHEAIDAHRGSPATSPLVARAQALSATWCAVSESAYVTHGWARLARESASADLPHGESLLLADGSTGWRLIGSGPGPAIAADPVVPFVRGVLGAAQRGAD
ncbi:MAG TPA: hypothetical protein VFV19_14590 [Candidatus Polarisedimenticolaceae bacterium]|nr:hypothetical protein [Candidatus Polarisedimenticolaceae bacterium]